jgi:hypothetical protein
LHRPIFLRIFAPPFGTPTIYQAVVANIYKRTANLSSETAAVLTAKIRATIIWLQTPVQFPGASAVYPSSISRQPNEQKRSLTLETNHPYGLER